ncbi:MAG: site-specific DNA-methyltransferase [Myxococcales bacterium]|nr:site-specific DNA-methyltransferase [Myxococcales bacterium]USN50335.1 MAG: site-specific DNA-methyltransferase [Myxococcales bacterium]
MTERLHPQTHVNPSICPKKPQETPAPKAPIPNQILCDDAISLMKTWPSQSFDACITDPPYNIAKNRKGLKWAFSNHVTMQSDWDRFIDEDYEAFTLAWLKEVCRVVKKNGNIFIFGTYHNIYLIGAIAQKFDLRIVNSIIWAKPNAQPNITCRMLTESTEQIIWLCNNTSKKATKWTFNYQEAKKLNEGKQMRNFWHFPLTPPSEKICGKHPSQKPLNLMERLVLLATNPKDFVLDCFAGSGSTLVACKKNQRRFLGIEKNSEYCSISSARLKLIE